MKKNVYIGFLVFCFCLANTLYAQSNRKAFYVDNKKCQSTETSQGLQCSKMEGKYGEKNTVIHQALKNQPSKTKNNYQFKLNIEGEWQCLAIGNGDDFFDLVYQFMIGGNTYQAVLPEGYYDIVISGYASDGNPAFYCFEQVLVNDNTELSATMADAIHKIDIAPVDENNTSLDDLDLVDTDIAYHLFMHHTIRMSFETSYGTWEGGFWPDLYLYVNDMGTRNKLWITADGYDVKTQNSYFIAMPMLEDGITEDLVLTNKSDEVLNFTQMYNISKDLKEESYSYQGTLLVFYDFETENHGWIMSSGWSSFRPHDREKPYSLLTNLKFNENPKTGDMNPFIFPLFYEFFDIYGNTDYEGIVAQYPMAINAKNELIVNFFSKLLDWSLNDPDGIVETICNNPLAKVWNKNEFYDEGYRTPLLFHQAYNANAETNPWEPSRMVNNTLLFLGEYGEQKYNHGDVMAVLKGDDAILFNDSIFIFNSTWDMDASHSKYKIEVDNDQVFAYGKKMINRSSIEFDLTKADANPPTLTMLRVIDKEKVSMAVTEETARLEITAGDFALDQVKVIVYDKKPDIQVSFSLDGETFTELTVEEDVAKFNRGYGNFFNVSLKPVMEMNTKDGWVTVKIVLTDDAGNSQVQILEPLFHVGTLNINDVSFGEQKNHAYPNPFNDVVNIKLENPLSGEVYFEVYDISGKIIHQQKYNCDQTTNFQWNGSHVTAGVYFYGIYSKEGVSRGKLVKQ